MPTRGIRVAVLGKVADAEVVVSAVVPSALSDAGLGDPFAINTGVPAARVPVTCFC